MASEKIGQGCIEFAGGSDGSEGNETNGLAWSFGEPKLSRIDEATIDSTKELEVVIFGCTGDGALAGAKLFQREVAERTQRPGFA